MKELYNYDSFDNSYEVNNYPWGFKMRTSRKYWVESNKRGDRFCFATLDPRSNKWCKPKKGTYDKVCIMYLDENNYVKQKGVSMYSNNDQLADFLNTINPEQLNEFQKKAICYVRSFNKVMKNVEFKVEVREYKPIILGSKTQEQQELKKQEIARQEARKIKEENDFKILNRAINNQYAVCLKHNKLKVGS